MQEIPLTQGKVALVDDVDFEWASQWKWFAQRGRGKEGRPWYAVRNVPGYPHQGKILLHREIAARAGLPHSRWYDHQDGDGLNNQRSNIRRCTPGQNQANSRKRSGTTSNFKGVCWNKYHGKWYARIDVARKTHPLGWFNDEQAAATAYKEAALKYYGEFAQA